MTLGIPVQTALDGIPVHVTDLVPLERTEKDGTKTPLLCWRVLGTILVHPERLELFKAAAAR